MVGEKVVLKNSQIVMAFEALVRIGDMQLEPRTAYWLSRNFSALQPIYNQVQEERNEIIIKHGQKDEVSGQILVQPTIKDGDKDVPNPAIELVTAELRDMLERDVEVTLNKLTLSGFIGNLRLQDMNALSVMIEDAGIDSNVVVLPKGVKFSPKQN